MDLWTFIPDDYQRSGLTIVAVCGPCVCVWIWVVPLKKKWCGVCICSQRFFCSYPNKVFVLVYIPTEHNVCTHRYASRWRKMKEHNAGSHTAVNAFFVFKKNTLTTDTTVVTDFVLLCVSVKKAGWTGSTSRLWTPSTMTTSKANKPVINQYLNTVQIFHLCIQFTVENPDLNLYCLCCKAYFLILIN